MNKQLIIILVAVLLIVVGFSGCFEDNDDEAFLLKAEAIADDMYVITSYNIYSKGDKATSYRLEIADYKLSSECEEIRDDLDFALGQIDFYYGQMQGTYSSRMDWSSTIKLINTCLKGVLDDIKRMK